MIKKYLKNKLVKRICDDLLFKAEYEGCIKKVKGKDVAHEVTLRNYKCHCNALDKYRKDNAFIIKVCWQTDKEGWGCVHFINYDVENEVYYDDTLGSDAIHYNFYVFDDNWIMDCINNHNWTATDLIDTVAKDLFNQYATWLERKFLKYSEAI